LTKNIFKNLLLFCLGCAAAFLLLELFLVFYTPLAGRVRGGKIILFPYKRYVVENTKFRPPDIDPQKFATFLTSRQF